MSKNCILYWDKTPTLWTSDVLLIIFILSFRIRRPRRLPVISRWHCHLFRLSVQVDPSVLVVTWQWQPLVVTSQWQQYAHRNNRVSVRLSLSVTSIKTNEAFSLKVYCLRLLYRNCRHTCMQQFSYSLRPVHTTNSTVLSVKFINSPV